MFDNIQCTGCGACFNICPVGAIEMKKDLYGFNYPYINTDKCIQCGKCERTCPSIEHKTGIADIDEQKAFIAVTKDKDVLFSSSSGGAFTEICRSFETDDLIIFGASFSMRGVEHSYVEKIEHLSRFRKSKYIQSNIKNMYQKAEEFLKEGKKVVFSGTPCQIAGLRNYLGCYYDNLVCIDLICHGVGSWDVFDECIKYAEKEYNSKILNYSFRAKKKYRGGASERHTSEYHIENGKSKLVEKDRYTQLFLEQLCLRECCGESCIYRTRDRQGDITISDFKNHKEIMKPSQYIQKEYSTVIANNVKGIQAINNLSKYMEMIPISMNDVLLDNPIYGSAGKSNIDSLAFWDDWLQIGAEKTIEKWTHKPQITLKEKVIRLIPLKIFILYYKMKKR